MKKHIVETVGGHIKLKCKTNENNNVTWYKNNTMQISSKMPWSLLLENVSNDDSGNYTCIACNRIKCINFTYELIIIGKLKINF